MCKSNVWRDSMAECGCSCFGTNRPCPKSWLGFQQRSSSFGQSSKCWNQTGLTAYVASLENCLLSSIFVSLFWLTFCCCSCSCTKLVALSFWREWLFSSRFWALELGCQFWAVSPWALGWARMVQSLVLLFWAVYAWFFGCMVWSLAVGWLLLCFY